MPDRDTLVFLVVILAASLALLAVTFVVWLQRSNAARSSAAAARSSAMSASSALPPTPNPAPNGGWRESVFAREQSDSPSDEELAEDDGATDRDGLVDPLTGLKTSLAWEEALRHEEARQGRYGRNATVVVGELSGLETLAERLGEEAADRLIPPVARTLLRGTRSADVVARVGHARFHVLLTETDEIAAINYVDRVRDATDLWLSAGAVAVRLALGWSSPKSGGTLADAVRVAEERMNADRRPSPSTRSVRRASARPRDVSA